MELHEQLQMIIDDYEKSNSYNQSYTMSINDVNVIRLAISEVKILPVAGVVGRSEQFICGKQDVSSTHQKCNAQCDGCKPRGNHSQ